jgi:hypothetical protein
MTPSPKSRPGCCASRPSFTEERGQALTELVLAAALMLPLMLTAYQAARLIYARLELVSLTREAAMYMIHEGKKAISADELRAFASRTRLDPAQVSAEVVAASLGSQLSSESPQGLQAMAQKLLLGSRLQVHYRIFFEGALGRLLPEGLEMTETAVFQSGTWKNLGLDALREILQI